MVRSQDLLGLARQGDPKAIATLMNRSLHSKQIAVKVRLKEDCLFVFASAPRAPEAPFVVDFVRQGLRKLAPKTIVRAVVQGHTNGNPTPVWQQVVDLREPPPPPAISPSVAPVSPPANPPASQPGIRPHFHPHVRPEVRRARRRPRRSPFEWILRSLGYGFAIAAFGAIAIVLKVFATLIAENALYQIQFLGDLLRGIELVEIFNVLIFAILGAGFGIATVALPRSLGVRFTAVLLAIVSPIVFSLSGWIRYDNWLDTFARNDGLSEVQARIATNRFLEDKIGARGFWGFYLYTAKFPVLPERQTEIDRMNELDDRIVSRVTGALGFSSDRLYSIFGLCIWGVRGFYFLLSGVTAGAHFIQGITLADKLAKRDTP